MPLEAPTAPDPSTADATDPADVNGQSAPPTSTISDDEIPGLLDQFSTADPPQQKLIGGLLLQYRDQVTRQAQVAQQQTSAAHFEKLFTDPDYFAQTAQNPTVQAAIADNPEAEAMKVRGANQAYLANTLGLQPQDLQGTYEMHRDTYAARNLGRPGGVTDQQFFDGVRKQQQQGIDMRQAVREVPADIVAASIDDLRNGTSTSPLQVIQAWREAHPDLQPNEGDEARMMQQAQSLQQNTSAFMQQYAPQVKTVFEAFGKDQKGPTDPQALAESLVSVPPDDRQRIYSMAALYAQKHGEDPRTYFQNLGQSVLRSVGGVANAMNFSAMEDQLSFTVSRLEHGAHQTSQKEGDPPSMDPNQILIPDGLTPEQYLAQTKQKLAGVQVARELYAAADGQIDPIKTIAKGWLGDLENASYGLAGSAPFLATSAVAPEVGLPLTAMALSSTENSRMRLQYPDLPLGQVRALSDISGAAQAVLMGLTVGSTFAKLPMTGAFLKSLARPGASAVETWGKFAAKSAVTGGELAVQGGLQTATPAIVDTVAHTLGADMPQYDGEKELADLKSAAPQVALQMLPLWLLGTGVLGIRDRAAWRDISSDADAMQAKFGIDRTSAQQAAAAPDPATKDAIIQKGWAAMPEAQKQALIQKQTKANESTQAIAGAPGMPGLRVATNPAGQAEFSLYHPETGELLYRTTDPSAFLEAHATAIRSGYDANQSAVSDMIAHFEQDNVNRGRSPDEQTFIHQPETSRTMADEAADHPEALDGLAERIRIAALTDPGIGHLPADQIQIFGHNVSEIREGVFHDTSTLLQGATPATVIEERVHGETDRAIHEGRATVDGLRDQVRAYEQSSGERLMSDDATPQEVREAVGALGVAYVMGRMRDRRLPTGLRGYLRQFTEYFKDVFARAGRLRKAIATGKVSEDFHDFLADSTGLSRSQRAEVTTGGRVAPGEVPSLSQAFSIGPVADLRTEDVPKFQKLGDLAKWVGDYFKKKHDELVHRSDLGDVIVDERGAASSIGHLIYRNKATAFLAVPEIIKSGEILQTSPDRRGEALDNIFIAAPIKIDGEDFAAVVRLRRDVNGTRFYVHQVEAKKVLQNLYNPVPPEGSDRGGFGAVFRILSERIKNKSFSVGRQGIDPVNSQVGRTWMNIAKDESTASHGETPEEIDFPSIFRKLIGPKADGIKVQEERTPSGQIWGYTFIEPDGRIHLDFTNPEEIFVNSSFAGSQSTPIYQAIFAWAHNTGRTIVEDPVSLSDIAVLRRTSQMLSSALRYGTTQHVQPGKESGISGWREGSDAETTTHNIGLLARREAELVRERLPFTRQMRYSPEEDAFYDGANKIPNDEFGAYIGRGIAKVDPNFAHGAGARTVARALVTAAAEKAGRGGLGRLVGPTSETSALKGIRYSLGDEPAASPIAPDFHTRVDDAKARVFAGVPGDHPQIIVHSDASSIADPDLRTAVAAEDAKGQGKVAALYNPGDGNIHLIGDRIAPEDIEGKIRHEALHWALDKNEQFRSEYTNLVGHFNRSIPDDLRASLQSRYGNDSAKITEEYLAHLAEAEPKGGVWRKFVVGVKTLLAKWFPQVKFSPNDIREFMRSRMTRAPSADDLSNNNLTGNLASGPQFSLGKDRIHNLAKPIGQAYKNEDDQARDPASVLASLVRGSDGATTGERGKYGRELASHSSLVAWADGHARNVRSADVFTGHGGGGGEHSVIYRPEEGRIYKLTKPGLHGAQAEDAGAYLQRLALGNRIFGDDVKFEGIVRMPGEDDYRTVISQPFIKGRDATAEEQTDFLRSRGFVEVEGKWIHPILGVKVWDTITPGNMIVQPDGTIRPVDLQIEPASSEELKTAREKSKQGLPPVFSIGQKLQNNFRSSANRVR